MGGGEFFKGFSITGQSSCTILDNPGDCHVQSWTILVIAMYNPGQSWGLSCTILIVMYNPQGIVMYNPVQSWGLSCTILYNPGDCHVQSLGLSCSIPRIVMFTIPRIVMYNPDCHVQSPGLSCTILIVMYNPQDCHVQSWLSCTILIVMYNPQDCHVQSWLSCTILMYNPQDCHVQSWLSCTILDNHLICINYANEVKHSKYANEPHLQFGLRKFSQCTILMYNPPFFFKC